MRKIGIFVVYVILATSFTVTFSVKTSIAYPTIIYVHPGESIQDAINTADLGDTIFVYAGTYHENIVIDKQIQLIGEKKENTVVDGGRKGTVVFILADDVVINNLTISNSGYDLFYENIYEMDAGITIKSNKVNVSHTIFNDNNIGILLFNSSNNYLWKNDFLSTGGCIYNFNTTYTQIIGNSFKSTTGGILTGETSYNTIMFNILHDVSIFGLYVWNCSHAYIENNTITGDNGFGILVINSVQNNICNNSVSINNPNMFSSFMLDDCCDNLIRGNHIYESRWDGMVFLSSSNNTIIENRLTDNRNSGLVIAYSSGNHIERNEIVNTDGDSVSVYGGSKNNNIKDNYISGFTFEGPGLLSSGINIQENSNENEIISNTITSHSLHGIHIYSNNNSIIGNLIENNSHDGINLEYANTNLISKNIITQNNNGVYLEEMSCNNQISKNSITSNKKSGIFIESFSNNNSILSNNFIGNNESAHIQLCGNIWKRNYWNRPRILPYKIVDDEGKYDKDKFPRLFPLNIENNLPGQIPCI